MSLDAPAAVGMMRRLREAFTSRLNLAMLLANAIGVVAFVHRASAAWADPQERAAGIHSVTGEPFVWFMMILPVVVACLLINGTWAVVTLVRRQWGNAIPFILVGVLWVAACLFDNAHH